MSVYDITFIICVCARAQVLERNWKTIRDEALAVMDQNTGLFIPEEENLREKGEWGQYTLWQQGTTISRGPTRQTVSASSPPKCDVRYCLFTFRQKSGKLLSGRPKDLLPTGAVPRSHRLQERTGESRPCLRPTAVHPPPDCNEPADKKTYFRAVRCVQQLILLL